MASDNYLKNIHSPADIKGMSYAQLNELAAEIRTVLIDTVSKNGGHLASNLGVVELTLAMHKEFDSPRDKFVWDVGHQAYTQAAHRQIRALSHPASGGRTFRILPPR